MLRFKTEHFSEYYETEAHLKFRHYLEGLCEQMIPPVTCSFSCKYVFWLFNWGEHFYNLPSGPYLSDLLMKNN